MFFSKKIRILKEANAVAVILAGSIGAISIIRALGKSKIPCIVIGHEYHHVSRYTTLFYPATSKEDVVKNLFLIPSLLRVKPVLLTDSDEYIDLISSNLDKLHEFYYIPFTLSNYFLIDKNQLSTLRCEAALPISFQSIYDIQNYHFPVIIKPLWHDRQFHNLNIIPEKAYICQNFDQVEQIDLFFRGINVKYITQQLIEGEVETIYTTLLYRGRKGNTEVGYVSKKIRAYPSQFGVGSLNELVENPEIVNQSISLMELTNYQGIAEFEYKFCEKTKKYYLIEVNGRFPLQTSLLQKSNPFFIHNIFCDLMNNRVEISDTQQKKTRTLWIFFINDVRAIRAEGKSMVYLYIRMLLSKRIQGAIWSFLDPLPAIYFCKKIAKKLYKEKTLTLIN
ncbi:MAG: ATP-grasp protein-like protein [Bacillales bacterium]|nr:ATP-grasp protein-like protein [Bacillales bacterium]